MRVRFLLFVFFCHLEHFHEKSVLNVRLPSNRNTPRRRDFVSHLDVCAKNRIIAKNTICFPILYIAFFTFLEASIRQSSIGERRGIRIILLYISIALFALLLRRQIIVLISIVSIASTFFLRKLIVTLAIRVKA